MLNESKRRGDSFVHIFEVLYVLKRKKVKACNFWVAKSPNSDIHKTNTDESLESLMPHMHRL